MTGDAGPEVETIYALSSAAGRAGVAVIRISGPAASKVLHQLAGDVPRPRFARLRQLRDPGTHAALDQALVLWFPAPSSFTGEDMAELQIHGGRAVIQAVLRGIGSIANCRMAEAGEFTRRAFENGKLDLTAVEGLADLIDAETEAQRRQALRQAGGFLARTYDGWRQQLIDAAALVEAAIDFSDQADVSLDTVQLAQTKVAALRSAILAHLDDGRRGEILREGVHVVIAGAPNAGKSSLLNTLARRDAAIVSEEAGTTRDVIEVKLDLYGLPIVVCDTAGIRTTTAKVENEGIRRAVDRARAADIVIWLVDATAPIVEPPDELRGGAGVTLLVWSKSDLITQLPRCDKAHEDNGDRASEPLLISVRTGEGLDRLCRELADLARARLGDCESPALTQARHRQLLEACRDALDLFLDGSSRDLELRAEDLRQAAMLLGRVTGRIDVEDVLEQVFGRFCIGK
jgi:tRNA modification GTPase